MNYPGLQKMDQFHQDHMKMALQKGDRIYAIEVMVDQLLVWLAALVPGAGVGGIDSKLDQIIAAQVSVATKLDQVIANQASLDPAALQAQVDKLTSSSDALKAAIAAAAPANQ